MLKLDDLEVYQLSMEVSDEIWDLVSKWESFEKFSIGTQFVKAADSISANISEGYGRFFYNENKQFCYYSRGSLLETKTWLTKSFKRKLITENTYKKMIEKLEQNHIKLNAYIKSIKRQISKWNIFNYDQW